MHFSGVRLKIPGLQPVKAAARFRDCQRGFVDVNRSDLGTLLSQREGRATGAAIGAANSMLVDPSGIGNAKKVAPIPPPRISVPTIPQFK